MHSVSHNNMSQHSCKTARDSASPLSRLQSDHTSVLVRDCWIGIVVVSTAVERNAHGNKLATPSCARTGSMGCRRALKTARVCDSCLCPSSTQNAPQDCQKRKKVDGRADVIWRRNRPRFFARHRACGRKVRQVVTTIHEYHTISLCRRPL